MVIYGLFHGLIFLPVILSIVGPNPFDISHHHRLSDISAEVAAAIDQPSIKVMEKDVEETVKMINNPVNVTTIFYYNC